MLEKNKYSIDTSAILDAWVRLYPPDIFRALWLNIESLINDEQLFATEEVLYELEKKEDEVFKWAKKQKMFIPISVEIQQIASQVLSEFPRLVDTRKDRTQADPFVIALAKHKNFTVVTSEKATGTPDKPRIPIVCQNLGIKCINLIQFIRELNWRF